MLRGLGVTMALPWMESLRVWGDVVLVILECHQVFHLMAISGRLLQPNSILKFRMHFSLSLDILTDLVSCLFRADICEDSILILQSVVFKLP